MFLGVYGAGVAWGLEDAGLTDVFDHVVGVSTGAVTGAYFLSGQMSTGAPIFYEDLVDGRFLNLRRVNNVIDLDYLIDIFKTKKPLDTEALLKARSELSVAVTNLTTGRGEVMRAKDKGVDVIETIKAALSLPGLYNNRTYIKGEAYCDGVYGFPNPIEYAIRELGCTDVVVVVNRRVDSRIETPIPAFMETIIAKTLLRNYSQEFRMAYRNRQRHYDHDMGFLWGEEILSNVNIGLIGRGKMPITRFSQDADKIRRVADEARQQARDIFI